MPNHSGPLIAIVGPTAVGKTALSIALGRRLRGQVVSADSRQIYRRMDIGTAKATPQEQALLPHHLLDIVEPDDVLTLAQYQALAYDAIDAILAQGDLPLLVGGTGQYVRAVLEGWTIPEIPPDHALRAELESVAQAEGIQALHSRLEAVDPVAAARIDARNVRRVIRALEVHTLTGQPISCLQRKDPPGYDVLQIGLTMERGPLYARIDNRIDRMVAEGLVQEVESLLAQGYDPDMPSMTGLGYRQIVQYLRGEIDIDEAVRLSRRDTRRFVRQQYNWFRISNTDIHWYDVGETPLLDADGQILDHELVGRVRSFLESSRLTRSSTEDS